MGLALVSDPSLQFDLLFLKNQPIMNMWSCCGRVRSVWSHKVGRLKRLSVRRRRTRHVNYCQSLPRLIQVAAVGFLHARIADPSRCLKSTSALESGHIHIVIELRVQLGPLIE